MLWIYIASYFMTDDRSLGEAVNRTARLLRRLADQRLAPLGLSAGYLPVLTALMRQDAMSQKALTEQAGIEQPTMAATLARMGRDGVIERRPDPHDKRSALFTLSAGTRSRSTAITAAIAGLNADAVSGMSGEERERLRDLLAIVVATVEKILRETT